MPRAMQRLCLWYGRRLQCLVDIINHMLKECNKEPSNQHLELWSIYFVNMPNDYSLSLIDKILCCHKQSESSHPFVIWMHDLSAL